MITVGPSTDTPSPLERANAQAMPQPPGMGGLTRTYPIDTPQHSGKGKGVDDAWRGYNERLRHSQGAGYQSVYAEAQGEGAKFVRKC